VLGNHDVESPGPPLTAPLREALQAHGVQLIEGLMVPWKGWALVGLDDHWGGSPGPQVARLWPDGATTPAASNRIALAHQPDTLALIPEKGAYLAIAGHTHGGQIWIPGLTPWWLRNTNSEQPWWNGLYETVQGHLFVTPGIGTVGLPARLAVPPTIDVLDLKR
jgi:predicted MPP superfamily phosphohydrolase